MAHPRRTTITPPPFKVDPEKLATVPEGAEILYKVVSRKRSNGDVYKSYRALYYSKDRKKNVILQTVLFGVIRAADAVTGKISPTTPRNYRELERQNRLEEEANKRHEALRHQDDVIESQQKLANDQIHMLVKHMFDTRMSHRVIYPLSDVMLTALFATLSGNSGATGTADYAEIYAEDMKRFFPHWACNGMTSDCVRQIFTLHQSDGIVNLCEVIQQSTQSPLPCVLSMDGQTVRASSNTEGRPHMLMSLYNCDAKQTVRHIRIADKSNEIPAGPELISELDLHGCVVTADAMSTQKETVAAIIDQGGHYCLALKENQPTLYDEVDYLFATQTRDSAPKSVIGNVEIEHGRIEQREYWILPARMLRKDTTWYWAGLREGCIVMTVTHSESKKTGKVSEERRYFITSLAYDDEMTPEAIAHSVREHWAIENKLHYKLDVMFRQDQMQCRHPSYLACCGTLNKTALNIMEQLLALYRKEGVELSIPRLVARLQTPDQIMAHLARIAG